MKLSSILVATAALATFATAEEAGPPPSIGQDCANHFSLKLPLVKLRLDAIEKELLLLPVMSDMDARGTHGFHSNFIPTSEENWFTISWTTPCLIDAISLIPTRIITQSGIRLNYGLPASIRIEATGPGHTGKFTLAEVQDTRLDVRQGEPIFLSLPPTRVTSLKFIPINLPTLPGKSVRFFSLAELMVYQGSENIAGSGSFDSAFSIDTEAGWNIRYLSDSQSPLGPPELPIAGESLGWHADSTTDANAPTWAILDLGRSREFEMIRLIAARGDAPIKGPGFGFPVRFSLETTEDPASATWRTLWTTGETDYDNPGYNPAEFHFPHTTGRYVRLMVTKRHVPDRLTTPRVIVSEFEVIHDGRNLALGAPVTTPDQISSRMHDATRVWSSRGLTDGYSSTGKLIPEREWVASLSHRFDLLCEKQKLRLELSLIVTFWQKAFLAISFLLLATVILGLLVWQVRLRLANRKSLEDLRLRISSDLHDEVGSNLATISLLSELAPAPGNLDDINRLSRETSLALREIVEISLASKRARKPLLDRLREIAALMLREYRWSFEGQGSPNFSLEQRRHLIFFFKEALHNIIRHAGATRVRIHFENTGSIFRLIVEDDGIGIQASSSDVLENLHTLHQRAKSLGGSLKVNSGTHSGTGTCLTLSFPSPHPSRK